MARNTNTGKKKQIGALWKNSKNGKTYLTGSLDDLRLVIFPNGFKDEQKAGAPDFIIYESTPLEKGTNGNRNDDF